MLSFEERYPSNLVLDTAGYKTENISLLSMAPSDSCSHRLEDLFHFYRLHSLGKSVRGSFSGGLSSFSWLDHLGLFSVKFHELGKIELRLLENLDLLDEDVLEREDFGALLGDLLANLVG